SLNNPFGVAVDGASNLFISDQANHRIRRVDIGTTLISTVAGNGTPAFTGDGGPATAASISSPNGVAMSSSGDLYFADAGNQRVRRVPGLGIAAPADLVVTNTDSPDPVFAGSNLTYTVTVFNLGPGGATNVVLTDVLPPNVNFVSA